MPTLGQLMEQHGRALSPGMKSILEECFAQSQESGTANGDALDWARNRLIDFCRYVSPGFQVNWHHEVIAAHLELVLEGRIQKLMVLAPPQHTKSMMVSELFPAFALGKANEAIATAAFTASKANAEAQAVYKIMFSQEYRHVFPLTQVAPRTDVAKGWVRQKNEFNMVDRTRVGYRAVGIGGSLTGFPKTIGIIDDPVKDYKDAQSETMRNRVWDWYAGVYRARDNRIIAAHQGVRDILVMTPWHEDDLHGRLLEREPDKWHVLRLPAYLDTTTVLEKDPDDPRGPFEALWPQQHTMESLEELRQVMPGVFQSLYQTRPSNAGGNLFQRSQFKEWTRATLPESNGYWFVSIDAAFQSEKSTHSYVAIQVWIFDGRDRMYLVHAKRGHWDFMQTVNETMATIKMYPRIRELLIEDKANGVAILSALKSLLRGAILTPVKATDSKEVRATSVAPWVNSGAVYLPPAHEAPWLPEFLNDVCGFPKGKHDDHTDAMVHALGKLPESPSATVAAWRKLLGLSVAA